MNLEDKVKKYELRHAEQRKRIEELEEANKSLMELVTMLREEVNKLREGSEK